MNAPVVLCSGSEAETRGIARSLAASLLGGERIGLSGELGAGKTCFVRGLAEGLGIGPRLVRSPSFPILLPYEGGRLPLYHIDLFRLAQVDCEELGLRDYLYGAGVGVVEWFERLDEPLEDFLEISFTFVGTRSRRLVAVGHGVGYHAMLEVLETVTRE